MPRIMKNNIAASNPDTISIGHLLETCDGYLALYKEVFTDLGYVPYDFNDLDESEENLFAIATRAKSNLFKAHAAGLYANTHSLPVDSGQKHAGTFWISSAVDFNPPR